MDDTRAVMSENAEGDPVGIVLRSILVHLTVWILVAVLGPMVIVLSPFTGGNVVFWAGRIWAIAILKVAGVKLEIEGLEKVPRDKGQVLVGNHASNFDIYVMILALKDHYYRFLVKKELAKIPIFGWALLASGFPFVDRGNSAKARKTMDKLSRRIERTGMSILAFPEGTRNRTETLMRFKKGVFVLAIENAMPVVPFSIEGAQRVQRRHGFRVTTGTIRLTFFDPIPTVGMQYEDRDGLIEKTRDLIKTQLDTGGQ